MRLIQLRLPVTLLVLACLWLAGPTFAQQETTPPAATNNTAISSQTKVFQLKAAKAAEIGSLIQSLYGGHAESPDLAVRVAADDRTNSLVVTGPADRLKGIESLVGRLDQNPKADDVVLDVQKKLEVGRIDDAVRALYSVATDSAKKGPAAYMGVGVEAPNDVLRAQLGLSDGTGLVVNYVDEKGPSKDLIHLHDVLEKLDGQILINGEQFATLVRMHKRDDQVTLTVIRRAKPTQIAVTLGEKELSAGPSDPNGFNTARAEVLSGPIDFTPVRLDVSSARPAAEFLLTQTGPITYDDGRTLAAMLVTGGEDYLSAFDRSTGKLEFFGPIGNEQEWNAVPDTLRNTLSSWRQMILAHESPRNSRVPVLSDAPIINRLYTTDRLADPSPATQPSSAERK